MYKFTRVVFFYGLMFFSLNVQAVENCFVAKEKGRVIKQSGDCDKRYSPFSTFKIPIALMGFDSGILVSPDAPVVAFTTEIEKEFSPYYNPIKYPSQRFSVRNQTPESWMKYSVVWYSQYITKKLGNEAFQGYVKRFNYGNKDVTGEPGKHNGLTGVWIGSSLKISPLEQVAFIENLVNAKLPISKQAQENTKKIMKLEPLFDEWQLYGKTGGSIKQGWFVGWVEKEERVIAFAQYIEQPETALISGGRMAKEVAKDNLTSLILKPY